MNDLFPQPVEIQRILLACLQEILGAEGLDSLLQTCDLPTTGQDPNQQGAPFPPGTWQALCAALLQTYGDAGARGLAIRVGEALFNDLYRCFGNSLGFTDQSFRMLPKPQRIFSGLETLADLHNQLLPGFQVEVFQGENDWRWIARERPAANHPAEALALLPMLVDGVIQEFLSWTSGGKFYPVRRPERAGGEGREMIFVISRKYLS